MRRLAAVLLLLICPAVALAQRGKVRPPARGARPTRPAKVGPETPAAQGGDTTKSGQPADLVQWAPPDSVMQALLEREGYTPTRYQGGVAVFDARDKTLTLEGKPAAVAREQTILVGDTIAYNDSTRVVVARGDTIILRDPSHQASDLVALGRMVYDLRTRHALVTNVATAVESGEKWYVHADRAATSLGDTATHTPLAFYGRDGSITSCDDPVPDYHFQAREIKMVSRHTLVARPAVLYIGDIPVMWLPFIFQDMRTGRRSGILTPRFGISDIFRNSPSYRRHLENLGYYFALNDYMDAELWLDWRSGANPSPGDPGWTRLSGQMQYNWLDRFMRGTVGLAHLTQGDGTTQTNVAWRHQQDFSLHSHLSMDLNYTTNTVVQRQTTFNPYTAMATISSQANYQQQIGPFNLSLGGTRRQYPGRSEVDQTFPTVSLTAGALNLAPGIVWTPSFSANDTRMKNGLGGSYAYTPAPGGGLDSALVSPSTRNTTVSFDTPLQFGSFTWSNSFRLSDAANDFPQQNVRVVDVRDSSKVTIRNFARSYRTDVDWQTGINLPGLSRGKWNIAPSVAFTNVDGSAGYWVASERTGSFVHQAKRPQFALSVSPTFYGFFPGFGGFSRFRHALQPTVSFSYAPHANVSDDFLRALGYTRQGYLGANAQEMVTFGLTQNIEAKVRSPNDTNPQGGEKIKLLSLNFTPLSYDIERRRATGKSGFTNDQFSWSANSDLLPGFNIQMGYSLFQGNPLSDTAVFRPYRTSVSASLSLSQGQNPFAVLTRIFGRAIPEVTPAEQQGTGQTPETLGQQAATQSVVGRTRGTTPYEIPTGQGWQLSLSFSEARQRPPVGGTVIDIAPEQQCSFLLSVNQLSYEQCLANARTGGTNWTPPSTLTAGSPVYRVPPTESVQGSFSFNLTPKWAAQWQTSYDAVRHQFASHVVSLQRDLHDWRAIFAFTQAPNGNFAFNFFVALKAEPDLKFNYDRQTYRNYQVPSAGTTP